MTFGPRIIFLAAALALAACTTPEDIETNAYAFELTLDEKRVWDTLSDEQKARAAEYIRNGGTLFSSLSAD